MSPLADILVGPAASVATSSGSLPHDSCCLQDMNRVCCYMPGKHGGRLNMSDSAHRSTCGCSVSRQPAMTTWANHTAG
jgi:hypothetical protein